VTGIISRLRAATIRRACLPLRQRGGITFFASSKNAFEAQEGSGDPSSAHRRGGGSYFSHKGESRVSGGGGTFSTRSGEAKIRKDAWPNRGLHLEERTRDFSIEGRKSRKEAIRKN